MIIAADSGIIKGKTRGRRPSSHLLEIHLVLQQLEVLLQLEVVFLKEAIERLLHVPELSQESKTHTTHRRSHKLPVRLKASSDVRVPLNSVHVCSDLPLLLCVSLRGLDSFQVGQQQTSFLQNVTDIVLKQPKKKKNQEN